MEERAEGDQNRLFRGGVDTTCHYCQEEFELEDKVVLVREGRITFGDRTGNVTYALDDMDEVAMHPGCVGPYVAPEDEEVLRDIYKTEAEVNTGMAFAEGMAYLEGIDRAHDEEQEDEGRRTPVLRARQRRR